MNRFMIAGTRSGSGKTTITCAILQALVNRGLDVASFKCGPDYIDPMFHSRVIGADAHNLDRFFCPPETTRYLLQKYSHTYTVIEGVMGFYDGVKGAASSHQLAVETDTPVILVLDCKGMSDSIGALMQGFLHYRRPNGIIGFLFNRLPESLAGLARSLCEEMNVAFFGRFPSVPECAIESRHLGLVTAAEVAGLREKTNRLAALAEEFIDMDGLLNLTRREPLTACASPAIVRDGTVRVAVARDNAFCFYYRENDDLLRESGCELIDFSPLRDASLPEDIGGLILGGGYPELYAEKLSENRALLGEIRSRVAGGLPTIAECGGFLYLHDELQGEDGVFYPAVGAVSGRAYRTEKLRRFGYLHLHAPRDSLLFGEGWSVPAHEFHYWDSTRPGDDLTARKASSGAEYLCAHTSPTLYAGFPHLYYYSNPQVAARFVEKCMHHKEAENHGTN